MDYPWIDKRRRYAAVVRVTAASMSVSGQNDKVSNDERMRQHRNMAGSDTFDRGIHTRGHAFLLYGQDCHIVVTN